MATLPKVFSEAVKEASRAARFSAAQLVAHGLRALPGGFDRDVRIRSEAQSRLSASEPELQAPTFLAIRVKKKIETIAIEQLFLLAGRWCDGSTNLGCGKHVG
jgi:hypothetical protein